MTGEGTGATRRRRPAHGAAPLCSARAGGAPPRFVTHANAPYFFHPCCSRGRYFFLNAGILLLGYAAFLWVARGHEGSFAQGGHHPGHGLRVPREVELGAGPGSLSGSPASARSTQLLLAGGHLRARLAGYRTPGPDAAAAASPRAGGGGMPGLLPALEPL